MIGCVYSTLLVIFRSHFVCAPFLNHVHAARVGTMRSGSIGASVVRLARLQSMPSSNIDSSALLKAIVPVAVCGHTKCPPSSRFDSRFIPSPLYHKIFSDCRGVRGKQINDRRKDLQTIASAPSPLIHRSRGAYRSRRRPTRSAHPAASRSSRRRQHFPQHRSIDNPTDPHASGRPDQSRSTRPPQRR